MSKLLACHHAQAEPNCQSAQPTRPRLSPTERLQTSTTTGTCSPSDARETATRVLLKTVSAPAACALRLFSSSATSTLFRPLKSSATLPGTADVRISALSGASRRRPLAFVSLTVGPQPQGLQALQLKKTHRIQITVQRMRTWLPRAAPHITGPIHFSAQLLQHINGLSPTSQFPPFGGAGGNAPRRGAEMPRRLWI